MLTVKPIPVPQDGHPKPKNPVLMKHEFTCGLIAPKESGKTTLICNMLKFYSGYFHSILVFSPTLLSDEKWDWVKEQKLLIENIPLKKWIETQESKNKGVVVSRGTNVNLFNGIIPPIGDFDAKIPEECFFTEYDDDTFRDIMEEQNNVIKTLKKNGASKYLANRLLIIFDDLVGSPLFSGKRGSYFKCIVLIYT